MKPHETDIDADLAHRLRTTLTSVAATVTDDAGPARSSPPNATPHRRRMRPLPIAVGAAATAVALAAFGQAQTGEEYVDKLPPAGVISEGEVEGAKYWLVEPFHKDNCGRPMEGVELVAAELNRVGGQSEWNTVVTAYGEQRDEARCGIQYDAQAWLPDPRKAAYGWTSLEPGDDERPAGACAQTACAGIFAVHPTVTSLLVRTEGQQERVVETEPAADAPDGPRYAVVAYPRGTGVSTVSLRTRSGDVVNVVTRDLSRAGGDRPADVVR